MFGFVLRGDPGLQEEVLASVKANFPVGWDDLIGPALERAAASAGTTLSIGLGLLLYSGTGMVVAIERGLNRAFGAARSGNFVVQRWSAGWSRSGWCWPSRSRSAGRSAGPPACCRM